MTFLYSLTINKIQVEFGKGDFASILPEVMTPDRIETAEMFGSLPKFTVKFIGTWLSSKYRLSLKKKVDRNYDP